MLFVFCLNLCHLVFQKTDILSKQLQDPKIYSGEGMRLSEFTTNKGARSTTCGIILLRLLWPSFVIISLVDKSRELSSSPDCRKFMSKPSWLQRLFMSMSPKTWFSKGRQAFTTKRLSTPRTLENIVNGSNKLVALWVDSLHCSSWGGSAGEKKFHLQI